MDKQRSDELIQKLVENRLTRSEFDEIISGINDGETVVFLESSLREHYEAILYRFYSEFNKEPDPEKEFRK